MRKPQAVTAQLFLHIAHFMRLDTYQPINQISWADDLGVSQPTLGRAIDELVAAGVYLEGEKVGTARVFKINPAYPGVQFLFNRQRA